MIQSRIQKISMVCFIIKQWSKEERHMNEINLSSNNFNCEITNTNKLVLIDFFATWCGPCKMLSPIISEIADEYSNSIKVCKVNVDENQDLAMKYNIMNVPTLLFIKNEKIIKSSIGFCSKSELNNIINGLL